MAKSSEQLGYETLLRLDRRRYKAVQKAQKAKDIVENGIWVGAVWTAIGAAGMKGVFTVIESVKDQNAPEYVTYPTIAAVGILTGALKTLAGDYRIRRNFGEYRFQKRRVKQLNDEHLQLASWVDGPKTLSPVDEKSVDVFARELETDAFVSEIQAWGVQK